MNMIASPDRRTRQQASRVKYSIGMLDSALKAYKKADFDVFLKQFDKGQPLDVQAHKLLQAEKLINRFLELMRQKVGGAILIENNGEEPKAVSSFRIGQSLKSAVTQVTGALETTINDQTGVHLYLVLKAVTPAEIEAKFLTIRENLISLLTDLANSGGLSETMVETTLLEVQTIRDEVETLLQAGVRPQKINGAAISNAATEQQKAFLDQHQVAEHTKPKSSKSSKPATPSSSPTPPAKKDDKTDNFSNTTNQARGGTNNSNDKTPEQPMTIYEAVQKLIKDSGVDPMTQWVMAMEDISATDDENPWVSASELYDTEDNRAAKLFEAVLITIKSKIKSLGLRLVREEPNESNDLEEERYQFEWTN